MEPCPATRSIWRRLVWPARIAAGVLLAVLGILGLILPVLPGWPFLIGAVFMIAPESRMAHWIRKQAERIKARASAALGRRSKPRGGPNDSPPSC